MKSIQCKYTAGQRKPTQLSGCLLPPNTTSVEACQVTDVKVDMNVKHFPIVAVLKCQNRVMSCIVSPTLITFWSAESETFPKIHHGKLRSWAFSTYCSLLFPAKLLKTQFLPVVIPEALCLHWRNIIHCHVKPLPCLQPLSCPTIYIWNDCSHSQVVSLSINSTPLCHPLADLSIPLSFPCCLYFSFPP